MIILWLIHNSLCNIIIIYYVNRIMFYIENGYRICKCNPFMGKRVSSIKMWQELLIFSLFKFMELFMEKFVLQIACKDYTNMF